VDFTSPIGAIIPSLEGEIFTVLARTSAPLSGSRVALLAANGSNPGIRRALARLVRLGTVTAVPSGSSVLYSANREHLLWSAIEASVRSAERSLHEVKDRLSALADRHDAGSDGPATILALFGSVARGSSDAESDIDVLAVFPGPRMSHADDNLIDEIVSRVPLWTGNACSVYAITRAELADLVEREDSMVESWRSEADTFHGRDVRELLGNPHTTKARG
jgi:predicted nucleotidyltransferase